MKSRTIVIGDIHGSYLALVEVIEKIKPTQRDLLIFLGDYTDGWADCIRTLKYLLLIKKTFPNTIFIKGNHDVWVQAFVKYGVITPSWIKYGGAITCTQLKKETDKEFRDELISFYEGLVDFYVDDKNRAFVHGGWDTKYGLNRLKTLPSNFYWDRSLWSATLNEFSYTVGESTTFDFKNSTGVIPPRLKMYKEVFIGHTTTTKIGYTRPVRLFNLTNMDSGAGGIGRLAAMNIDTKTVWLSKFVQVLYPDDPHGKKV